MKNYVLSGQLNNLSGEIFENKSIKHFIKMAEEHTLIAKHIILDFATKENSKLTVIESKNYSDPSSALSKAKTSLNKIKHSKTNIDLKVITTDNSRPEHIFLDLSKTDKNYVNEKLKIKLNDVNELATFINFYFSETAIIDQMKEWIDLLDKYKDELEKLNSGKKSELDVFFIKISDFYKKITKTKLSLIKKLKFKKGLGYSLNEIRQMKIHEYFERISEKNET